MTDDTRDLPSTNAFPTVESLTVTAGQLARFMTAKGHDKPCACCGNDDWLIAVADGYVDGDDNAPVQLASLPGIAIRRSIPVHTPMCKDCGSVKLIFAATVRDWVEKNG